MLKVQRQKSSKVKEFKVNSSKFKGFHAAEERNILTKQSKKRQQIELKTYIFKTPVSLLLSCCCRSVFPKIRIKGSKGR